ncbi:hypothetical protein V6N13_118034 [Hibiscus sabdariffa]|uniref:Uncharacterized protein n=1 Tax=Hibiscus sabdariffa TaxID=183260 RepID=A0ABR2Q8Z7_9ROSI
MSILMNRSSVVTSNEPTHEREGCLGILLQGHAVSKDGDEQVINGYRDRISSTRLLKLILVYLAAFLSLNFITDAWSSINKLSERPHCCSCGTPFNFGLVTFSVFFVTSAWYLVSVFSASVQSVAFIWNWLRFERRIEWRNKSSKWWGFQMVELAP